MNTRNGLFSTLRFRQNAIWLIPLFVIITFPLWSIPVKNFLAPPSITNEKQGKKPKQTRNFNLQAIKITLHKNGEKTATILASSARNDSTETLLLYDVDAKLYDKDNNVTKIKGKEGEYTTKRQFLTLKDNVIIEKTADQQVLYTDLLYFDNNDQTVRCPGTTKIVAPGITINSGSLHYNIETATYNLEKSVHCTITNFANNS